MKIKKPERHFEYTPFLWREEASAPEILWHRNRIKRFLYRAFINRLNTWIFQRYRRWIEL